MRWVLDARSPLENGLRESGLFCGLSGMLTMAEAIAYEWLRPLRRPPKVTKYVWFTGWPVGAGESVIFGSSGCVLFGLAEAEGGEEGSDASN